MNLIALDLDGTTLNPSGILTTAVATQLKIALTKNLKIAFCSGRPISGVRPVIEKIMLDPSWYHITNNGATIENYCGEYLYQDLLTKKDFLQVEKFCKENKMDLIAVSKKGIHTLEKRVNQSALMFGYLTDNPLFFETKMTLKNQMNFSKFLVCGNKNYISKIKQMVSQTFMKDYSCVQGHEEFIEISKIGNSKGNALSKLTNYYKISNDNVFIVGDNENDLSMFENYPQSIAMGNAIEEIKELAKWQCPTNQQEGIIQALDLILNEIKQ